MHIDFPTWVKVTGCKTETHRFVSLQHSKAQPAGLVNIDRTVSRWSAPVGKLYWQGVRRVRL